MTLADGSEISYGIYGVTVLWDGQRIYFEAAADTTPLAGMRFLDGHDLIIQVRHRGRVVIQTGEQPGLSPAGTRREP